MRHGLSAIAVVSASALVLAKEPTAGVSSRVEAPGARIDATAAPSRATVADTIVLRIEARAEPGVWIDWPGVLALGADVGGLTIARVREVPDAIDAEGMLRGAREFELEPFLPGVATIGPLEFVIRDGVGESRTLTRGAMTVTVESLLPNANATLAEPRGVVDLAPDGAGRWNVVVLGGAAALVLLAGAGAVLAARRLRARSDDVTPSQRALAALALLDGRVRGESSVGARPSSDEAYTALSSALRRYIEERFGVRAGVLTTEEFFAHATTRGRLPPTRSTRWFPCCGSATR